MWTSDLYRRSPPSRLLMRRHGDWGSVGDFRSNLVIYEPRPSGHEPRGRVTWPVAYSPSRSVCRWAVPSLYLPYLSGWGRSCAVRAAVQPKLGTRRRASHIYSAHGRHMFTCGGVHVCLPLTVWIADRASQVAVYACRSLAWHKPTCGSVSTRGGRRGNAERVPMGRARRGDSASCDRSSQWPGQLQWA